MCSFFQASNKQIQVFEGDICSFRPIIFGIVSSNFEGCKPFFEAAHICVIDSPVFNDDQSIISSDINVQKRFNLIISQSEKQTHLYRVLDEADWRMLALDALQSLRFDIARKAGCWEGTISRKPELSSTKRGATSFKVVLPVFKLYPATLNLGLQSGVWSHLLNVFLLLIFLQTHKSCCMGWIFRCVKRMQILKTGGVDTKGTKIYPGD